MDCKSNWNACKFEYSQVQAFRYIVQRDRKIEEEKKPEGRIETPSQSERSALLSESLSSF